MSFKKIKYLKGHIYVPQHSPPLFPTFLVCWHNLDYRSKPSQIRAWEKDLESLHETDEWEKIWFLHN